NSCNYTEQNNCSIELIGVSFASHACYDEKLAMRFDDLFIDYKLNDSLYLSKENLNSFLMINNNDTIFLKPPNNSTGLKTDVLKTRGHGRLFNYDSIKSHSELIKYIFESDFFYNKTYPICIVSDTVIVNFSYLDKN